MLLTTGDIAAHFAEIYDAQVSKDTISRITDRVVEEMQAWTSRPLERVYAAVLLDAINVKVPSARLRCPEFLDLVSNTNTHAARTRTGAHEAIS